MPDPHRIERESKTLLSRPEFSALFLHRNNFRKPLDKSGNPTPPATPESIAQGTANYLFKNNPLMDPVEIVALHGPLQFYRAHDGGARVNSAKSLGGSWVERAVAEQIWEGTAKYPAADRPKWYMEYMRTANFVLPEWNDMTHLVCMVVPAGNSIVVARGRGSWKAMRTPPGVTRPAGAPAIHTAADVLKSGMMPIPGLVQCLVPLLNDMWIQPVIYPSPKWPFLT